MFESTSAGRRARALALPPSLSFSVALLLSALASACAVAADPAGPALAKAALAPAVAKAGQASVALAGNAFITAAGPNSRARIAYPQGLVEWSDPSTVISSYVRIAKPGKFSLALKGEVPAGSVSHVRVSALGKSFDLRLTPQASVINSAATLQVEQPGYVKIDVQGLSRTGAVYAQLQAIELSGAAAVDAVHANAPADYYWSRRGPSVHLSFSTPAETEYAYSELTVPAGEDALGSYFMANGFGEGYMGIQVNGSVERRVLFSVWDPDGGGKTTLVKKGPNVVHNEFGGEGTGGQSYLVFPWVAGQTYQFITRVRPDGQGASLYSAWFRAPEDGQWRFIATWIRPKTVTWLTRFHGFTENFLDHRGHTGRKVLYGQNWVLGKNGVWTELNRARFTVDATGANRQRLDYAGGVDASGKFFMRNGGFFNETVAANQYFTRPLTGIRPDVQVEQLP